MKEIALTLPIPPKLNRLYRVSGGRIYKITPARTYRDTVFWLAKEQGVGKPFDGAIKLKVAWYRPANRGDIDSIIKCLLDVLQGVAYLNDSQICKLVVEKTLDKANPRVEVVVTQV